MLITDGEEGGRDIESCEGIVVTIMDFVKLEKWTIVVE